MQKIDVVRHILRNSSRGFVSGAGGVAWAPSNVALCKYWGKRDLELNLPMTSSLSVSLGNKGAFTQIKQEGNTDQYFVNGVVVNSDTKFAKRLQKFLDLFRLEGVHYLIKINTNVPIAAGFASSACGFASLVQALDQLYGWHLCKKDLSILARLGSGSACRSLFEGFVEWQKGDSYDGMDSYGVKLEYIWPELRIGLLTISTQEKAISSRDAMEQTVRTSPLYPNWPKQAEQDLANLKSALARQDFVLLGEVAEKNAIAMHAMLGAAKPPIVYSLLKTSASISKVQEMRLKGLPIFFTQDAGPNLQLLFLAKHAAAVHQAFPELDVVLPFVDGNAQQVILVDDNDVAIGASEKLAAHITGKLHRAFSVFILRRHNNKVEVLLQQRSAAKYHSANLWSNSCCGHPYPSEDITTAAKRRLREEMGFSVELNEIGKFHYLAKFPEVDLIENEIDHVLIGFSDLNEFPVNILEVQNFYWVGLTDLKKDLQNNPDKYTVWLEPALNLVLQNQFSCF